METHTSLPAAKRENSYAAFWISLAVFSLYFGIFLLPKFDPSFRALPLWMLFGFSFVLIAGLVFLAGLWSLAALAYAALAKHPMNPASRACGQIVAGAMASFIALQMISSLVPEQLPTGSGTSKFVREAWLKPEAAEYVKNDITPRQKMLADVVAQLPGQSRKDLEAMLGPSLKTSYFSSLKYDLIYVTGPQRDSSFGLDSEWLLIWLDGNGKFERYRIVND